MRGGGRDRGLVPEFLLEVEGSRGLKKDELAELKVICCCPSRYLMIPPHPRPARECVKVVDKRAGGLTEEYKKKTKQVDRVMVGWLRGEFRGNWRTLEKSGGWCLGRLGRLVKVYMSWYMPWPTADSRL